MFSASGNLQYITVIQYMDIMSTLERYRKYAGGYSIHQRDIISTLGDRYLGYTGRCSLHQRDIVIRMGDIMIHVVDVTIHMIDITITFEEYHFSCGGYDG